MIYFNVSTPMCKICVCIGSLVFLFFHPVTFAYFIYLSPPPRRLAASSTSSVSYPGSPAASMTSVNCVARACGIAGTSPLWSVPVNTRTPRAAPMEAPPPHSPPHPPLHPRPLPHRTTPRHLRWRAREAPKPGIFSPFGNSPEAAVPSGELLLVLARVDTARFESILWIPELFAALELLSPHSPLLVCKDFLTEDFGPLILSCGAI